MTQLYAELAELKAEVAALEEDKKALKKLFTPNQIKKLKNPNKRLNWTVDDISKAIVIHSSGARTYRLLLKKGYPYPAVSTLRSWARKLQIVPGILKNVLKVVQNSELTKLQRICVLTFDEMKIKKVYCYDKAHDQTLKPYNYVQVCIIRGLIGNWKQPIYFDYDASMTKESLFQIINSVEEAGFPVVAMTCDLGGSNRGLHNSLDISYEKPYFVNPVNGHNIYVLADVPHLLKLIRNNFVDHGFVLKGKNINVGIVEKLLRLTKTSDLSIAHKISMDSIQVKGAQRQKVKLAAKLFSHTISRAISRCGMLGHFEDNDNWMECSEFFKLVSALISLSITYIKKLLF